MKGGQKMPQTDKDEREHIKEVLTKHLDRLERLDEKEERHGMSTLTNDLIRTAEAILSFTF